MVFLPEQSTLTSSDLPGGLVFLGLQGMQDSPRPEAIRTVARCQAVGIEVKMITGDHLLTRPISHPRAFVANPWVFGGALAMAFLQLVFTYHPAMNRIFGTVPIHPGYWIYPILCGLGVALAVEVEKWLRRKRKSKAPPAQDRVSQ